MTVAEQNQDRIERQMQTINKQADIIKDLYALLQKSLEHAPEFVKQRSAERLREMGLEQSEGML